MTQIRTFVGVKIEPTPELLAALTDLLDLGQALKTEPTENLHVTLKFLGSTEERLLPEIIEIIRKQAAAKRAAELSLTGLGAFPHLKRPAVVWVGLQGEGAQTLIDLAAGLESELEPLGFGREDRPFHPHLTLARVKTRPPRELTTYIEQHAATGYGIAPLRAVELFRSELKPTGSHYTVLESLPLG
jgi:2'-5' RNA ligase